MDSLSIVIPCKGRLAHLKETLPILDSYATELDIEILVVDYDCPDNTGAWIIGSNMFERTGVLSIENRPYFNRSHALNVGVMQTDSELVAVCDADCLATRGLLPHVMQVFDDDTKEDVAGLQNLPRRGDKGRGRGFYAFRRWCFLAIRGHDESFTGYGWEEVDFHRRLAKVGKVVEFPRRLCRAIDHGDELRTQFHRLGLRQSQARNRRRMLIEGRKVNPDGFGAA